jgi:hypothetical protein
MSIHIKKANKGKFTEYKKRTGKTTAEALHSKDPHVRKMANFARNAKKWHHAEGGLVQPFAKGGMTPEMAKMMLKDGMVRGKPLTEKQMKYFGMIAGGGMPKMGAGGILQTAGAGIGMIPTPYTKVLGMGMSLIGGVLGQDEQRQKDADMKQQQRIQGFNAGLPAALQYTPTFPGGGQVPDYTGMGTGFINNPNKNQIENDFYSRVQPDDPNRPRYTTGTVPTPGVAGGGILNKLDAIEHIASTPRIARLGTEAQAIFRETAPKWSKEIFNEYAKTAGLNSLGKYWTPNTINKMPRTYPEGGLVDKWSQQLSNSENPFLRTIGETGLHRQDIFDEFNTKNPGIASKIFDFPDLLLNNSAIGMAFKAGDTYKKDHPEKYRLTEGKQNNFKLNQQYVPMPGTPDANKYKGKDMYWQKYPDGGISPNGTPIEVEKGEVMRDPEDGSLAKIPENAPSHAQGGVDVSAQPGTQIYGKLKVKSGRFTGMTYKDAADKIRKEMDHLEKRK